MRCEHCGNEVPEGPFCTRCGAQQGVSAEAGDPRVRLGKYAAHPGEHVLQPGFVSTLLPHLGHHKVHEFRWALIAGTLGVFILYIAGLISAAVLVAAFLVPVLYLLYLYEAQVYRDEPLNVVGLTFGGGILVGIAVTLLVDYLSPQTAGLPAVSTVGTTLVVFVIVPIIVALVKPLPALPLRTRPRFSETVDGLVFGVATGLGYSISETLIRYSDVINHLSLHVEPGSWVYPLLTLALTRPLMQGTTAGLLAAAVWRMGRGKLSNLEIGAIVLGIAGEVAFIYGSQLLVNHGFSQITILAWQVIVDGGLVIYIRYLLHRALLDEAAHMGYSETVCPNCHHQVMASSFCPNCGKALTAAPGQLRDSRAASRGGAGAATKEGR